jgi:hypothetical protein
MRGIQLGTVRSVNAMGQLSHTNATTPVSSAYPLE